jgi:hypothetical protein
MSRFPVAVRLPAFASWPSFARRGMGLPHGWLTRLRYYKVGTTTGLSRFARMRHGRGGCPLYPGDCGAFTAGKPLRPPHAASQRRSP